MMTAKELIEIVTEANKPLKNGVPVKIVEFITQSGAHYLNIGARDASRSKVVPINLPQDISAGVLRQCLGDARKVLEWEFVESGDRNVPAP